MNDILRMGKDELLRLTVRDVPRSLTTEEFMHIATTLGAWWTYDYEAAQQGRVGKHAILKSELHSDAFFLAKIILALENIRDIMADQLVMRVEEFVCLSREVYVAGVPDGATMLGSAVAKKLSAREVQMKKEGGRIVLESDLPSNADVIPVEDVYTRGTAFAETVREIRSKQPSAKILPYNPVLLNRGGLRTFSVEGIGTFRVLSIAEWRIKDWDPADCGLCARGSTPIKPKISDEHWRSLITSQLE